MHTNFEHILWMVVNRKLYKGGMTELLIPKFSINLT